MDISHWDLHLLKVVYTNSVHNRIFFWPKHIKYIKTRFVPNSFKSYWMKILLSCDLDDLRKSTSFIIQVHNKIQLDRSLLIIIKTGILNFMFASE